MNHADFQTAFWHDLWSTDETPSSALTSQPGFMVYRNTVLKACVDTLLALHPAVRRLTGDDWLAAAALAHARERPPQTGCLASYGDGFPDHLARALPAGEWPWLPEVARLDALWNQSHIAADAPTLSPQALSTLDATTLPRTVLVPHPASRWHPCPEWPALSLWQAAREALPDPNPPHWRGQHTLLTRPHGTVLAHEIGIGACALLHACSQGQSIPVATALALAAEPGLDLAATLGQLITHGAFTAVAP
jgi:hypothetical protein